MQDRERRILAGARVETRAPNEPKKIVGYASVFETPYDIGGQFREQIMRGAFADAIVRDDIHALFNHDYGVVLGRAKAGTLALMEDDHGLRVEITPPDTQAARDLMANIEAGNIDQMSFAFTVSRGGQRWDDSGEIPLRTIERVDELFEVSIVPRGANPATEAALRSLDEVRAGAERAERDAQKDHNRINARRRRMRMNLRGKFAAREA